MMTKGKKELFKSEDAADYLGLIPGLVMCLILMIELIINVANPNMAEEQYVVFPQLFTVADYLIIAAGIVQLGIAAKRKKLHFKKTDALFAAFGLLIILSTCVNGFNIMTFDGVPYRYIGILNMMAFIIIYMGVSRSINSDTMRSLVLFAYLAAADLIGAVALYDLLTGGVAAFHNKKELSAVFFNGNHYGYFLLMAVLIGLAFFLFDSGRAAVFGAVSSALNLALLGINHSLGCILALIIVLVCTGVLILTRDRIYIKKLAVLTAGLLTAFIFMFIISPDIRNEFAGLARDLAAILDNTADGSAGHRRLQMWTLTCGYISERPLLGYGCEGIAFMLYEAMGVSNAHSEVLSYAAFYGIPAAIFYTAGVLGVIGSTAIDSSTNAPHKAACMAAAGYFISSFTGVGMFYTLPFFFIFLGLSSRY